MDYSDVFTFCKSFGLTKRKSNRTKSKLFRILEFERGGGNFFYLFVRDGSVSWIIEQDV